LSEDTEWWTVAIDCEQELSPSDLFDVVDGEYRGVYTSVLVGQDEAYWVYNIWHISGFVIGLTCNETSKQWEWIDGTQIC
ncbi:hypothetical protein PMAYCL1PPCAC_13579, partial [Pristionchus mayeri]